MSTRVVTKPVAEICGRFPIRIWVFFCILGAECFAAHMVPHGSVFFFGTLLIVFSGALIFFGQDQAVCRMKDNATFSVPLAVLHGLLLVAFFWIQLTRPRLVWGLTGMAVLNGREWTLWAMALLVTLVFAVFPTRTQWRLLAGFGRAWLYASVAAVAVIPCTFLLQDAWNIPNTWPGTLLREAAFAGVVHLLHLFYPVVVSDPSQQVLGTPRFQVWMAGQCSGIQGLGLMLVLTTSWLIYARRELRIARALLLIPFALVAVWILNLVRVAALIAIGNAGHEAVAVHGFHSDAGWVLFNAVAFAFLLIANRSRWLHRDGTNTPRTARAETRNEAVIYLLPFIAIVAASMVGKMASSSFDWLYPLRLLAALAVLWWFRAEYRRMDWRFGWLGPLAGVGIFALWLGLARWQHTQGAVLGAELQQLAPWQRVSWIATRAIAAMTTVPLAEELAFRGYLARRVMSADVEAVPYTSLSLAAILASSILFGAMHGGIWFAGTIAGLAFAIVAKLRGRLGEAVAAHATANLLIAAWVLATGDFGMW